MQNDHSKILMKNGSLMKVESIAECNIFDLHLAILGIETQFLVFLRVAVYTGFTVQPSHYELDHIDKTHPNKFYMKLLKKNA